MTELPTDLLSTQHSLVSIEQLRDRGFSHAAERWLVQSGRCERLSPRVLRLVGSASTTAQRLLGSVLDAGPGSALSHTSALAWWEVPGFVTDEVHITHARDGVHRPRRLASYVHDVVLLPDHHVRVLDGVTVVTPARALFDIAGMPNIPANRVERAVDNAWSMRLVSGRTMQAMLRDLAQRGRPGIRVMREILCDRGEEYIPPASGLEGRVVQILKRADIPALRRQVDTGDESGWIGRVDFADAEVPFILEVQSERFHSSLLDQRADAHRIARLEAAGFVVATVTDVEVWHHPDRVVSAVRAGRWKARSCPRFRGGSNENGGKNESADAVIAGVAGEAAGVA